MKFNDLENKTIQDLNSLLEEAKAKLVKFSFDLERRNLKDVSQIKKVKKDIARIMTKIKQLHT